jgi:hypothetical protein
VKDLALFYHQEPSRLNGRRGCSNAVVQITFSCRTAASRPKLFLTLESMQVERFRAAVSGLLAAGAVTLDVARGAWKEPHAYSFRSTGADLGRHSPSHRFSLTGSGLKLPLQGLPGSQIVEHSDG